MSTNCFKFIFSRGQRQKKPTSNKPSEYECKWETQRNKFLEKLRAKDHAAKENKNLADDYSTSSETPELKSHP